MSFAGYILGTVGVLLLLWALLAPRKRKQAATRNTAGAHDEGRATLDWKKWNERRKRSVERTAEPLATEEVVKDAREVPAQRMERLGVLTVDTTDSQVCEKCGSVWLGELIQSGKCGKCGGRLLVFVAEGAPPQYIVVPEERLAKLLTKLWVRAEQPS